MNEEATDRVEPQRQKRDKKYICMYVCMYIHVGRVAQSV